MCELGLIKMCVLPACTEGKKLNSVDQKHLYFMDFDSIVYLLHLNDVESFQTDVSRLEILILYTMMLSVSFTAYFF